LESAYGSSKSGWNKTKDKSKKIKGRKHMPKRSRTIGAASPLFAKQRGAGGEFMENKKQKF
jgi:hypothetical protein